MSTAGLIHRRVREGVKRKNFCHVSQRNRIKEVAVSITPWGGDDVMYQFKDGSKLIERTIVREFKLFKG